MAIWRSLRNDALPVELMLVRGMNLEARKLLQWKIHSNQRLHSKIQCV